MRRFKYRCAFCDQPAKLTKEHLWARWTKQLVRYDDDKHEHTVEVRNPTTVEKADRIGAGDVRNRGLKIVCGACNGGWMGDLEEQVKPLLTPMILGQYTRLSPAAQLIVSRWVAMKVAVGEYFDPPRAAVTLAERRAIMNDQPLPGWRFWWGRYNRERSGTQYIHTSMGLHIGSVPYGDDRSRPNLQTTMFIVGELYFNVLSSADPRLSAWVSLDVDAIGKAVEFPVATNIGWPPGGVLNDTAALGFGKAIWEVYYRSAFSVTESGLLIPPLALD